MAIPVKQNLVSKAKYGIKCPYSMEAEYITYHNTYNDATAEAEVKYMIGNNNEVSFHYAIDDIQVVQGIPTNRNAWACGDGGNGTGNRKSISAEVCYSKSGGSKYKKAEALANKFVAQLLFERGWGVDRVKPHQHWSGKNCPHRILNEKRWNTIIADIQKHLDALRGTNSATVKPAPSTGKGYLANGDRGAQVKELQVKLNKVGAKPKLVEDGIFGKGTESAVKEFQKDSRLAVDGLAGNATMQALEAVLDKMEADAKRKAEAKKREEEAKKAELPSNVYGTITVLVEQLNVRADASLKAKILKQIYKGKTYKVYGAKNGLYNLGAGNWCSSGTKYVSFKKNPNYGTKPKTIQVLAESLWVYYKADWNAKDFTVEKGEVFTIARELTVKGSKMYQLKSGVYITANPSYVKVR